MVSFKLEILLVLVALVACTKQVSQSGALDNSATPAPVFEPVIMEPNSARNMETDIDVQVDVAGIKSIEIASRLCYAAETANSPTTSSGSVVGVDCIEVKPRQTSVVLQIKNLNLSTRIFLFHDENSNSKLDFTVFDLLVTRREKIAEGYAFLEDPKSESTDPRVRRVLMLSPGINRLQATLFYEATALEEFLLEKATEQMIGVLRNMERRQ